MFLFIYHRQVEPISVSFDLREWDRSKQLLSPPHFLRISMKCSTIKKQAEQPPKRNILGIIRPSAIC